MLKAYIIWESSGSYEDYRKNIHKIYSDKSKANAECDRLNLELNIKRKRHDELHDHFFIEVKNEYFGKAYKIRCREAGCLLCKEFNDLEDLMELDDYTVEGVEVE